MAITNEERRRHKENAASFFEALVRLNNNSDMQQVLEYLNSRLFTLDVKSRRLSGSEIDTMNGRRLELEDVISLFTKAEESLEAAKR